MNISKEIICVTTRMLPPACEMKADACMLAFVSEGNCRLYIGRDSLLLPERSCALLRPGNSCRLEGYCSLTLVMFSPERILGSFSSVLSGSPLLSAFFLSGRASPVLAFSACDAEICSRLDAFKREYRKYRAGNEDILCCDLMALLLRLARSCPAQKNAPEDAEAEKQTRAYDLLLRRYKTVTLSELARELGVHPNTAAALLKKGTGKTFSELLIKIRMNHAAALLAHGKTVRETAAAIGYTNLTCFYKHFTAHFLKTPGEYRRLNGVNAAPDEPETE